MKNHAYTLDKNKLLLTNGYNCVFDYPISKALLVKDSCIVVLNIPPKVQENQNVFGVNMKGEIVWKIGKIHHFYEGSDCPFVDVILNKDGKVVLFNWCDTAVIIDPITGIVLDKYQTK